MTNVLYEAINCDVLPFLCSGQLDIKHDHRFGKVSHLSGTGQNLIENVMFSTLIRSPSASSFISFSIDSASFITLLAILLHLPQLMLSVTAESAKKLLRKVKGLEI